MPYETIKRIAKVSGATRLLDRVGLLDGLITGARRLAEPTERARHRILEEDLAATRARLAPLLKGLPPGNPARPAWVISGLPTVFAYKLDGVLAAALRLGDHQPICVRANRDPWARRYHTVFGLHREMAFHRVKARIPPPPPSPEVQAFLRDGGGARDLLAVTYHGVGIGRAVLSGIVYRNRFATVDLREPRLRGEIEAALVDAQHNVLAAERLLAETRPRLSVVIEKGLSPMAELCGVCWTQGVPVVQCVASQSMNQYILKRFTSTNSHDHPSSLDPTTWEWVRTMPWSSEDEAELMRDLRDGYSEGTWFSRKYLDQHRAIKPPAEVRAQLGLDSAKKTAVVFSHVLWDATFFYGDGLFDSYETWLVETVRMAAANPRLNWVIKLHPDLVWKLKHEGYVGELRESALLREVFGRLPDHVKLVMPETDISTYSFFAITDYSLTVRGTIGIEMACHGVPVLTAGTGRYAGLGFTIDAKSPEEYLERLAHLEEVSPVGRHQIELARRFAYALFRLRLWPLQCFEMVRRPLREIAHPLAYDIVPRFLDGELSGARDLGQLVSWIESGATDFMVPKGAFPVSDPPDRQR